MGKSVIASILLIFAGCSSNPNVDFDRHSMSWLIMPVSGEILLFHAKTDHRYPADNEEAESIRMLWLETWLKRRGVCQGGYEVTDGPRPFSSYEDNPHYAQLRYEIKCT